MKTILVIIVSALCAVTSRGQTIKTLGFNSTGQVIANTGTNTLTFTNNVAIHSITINEMAINGFGNAVDFDQGILGGNWEFNNAVNFGTENNKSTTRTNLGLPLPALTNTSNVTAMRALSGSTNTNHPFSGSVALTNTNTLVFSNGILQSVQ